jgi:hypothetical protein
MEPVGNPNDIGLAGIGARGDFFFPGHPFTDRVLRLLAEESGDRSRMTSRTVGDVSRRSARLRVTPRRWLQTRRLETRSSFSDRVRRELSNGGSVAQF